jgi:hypothetical protein
MPDILCSHGWQESWGIMMSVWVGFLYISNSNSFSLRCIVRSRELMQLCDSFSIVNFMVGCCSLNSVSVWSMFVFPWS